MARRAGDEEVDARHGREIERHDVAVERLGGAVRLDEGARVLVRLGREDVPVRDAGLAEREDGGVRAAAEGAHRDRLAR